ncbi:MerR family transcriptional regulator [Microbacterium pseudoresistens]|uniref:DNA-binding transcriptional MerR regulator n=1 Tax=Microbacterium pseudoresistens TaxID=640634 RepID=A0A7Y9JP23_9MICO|nr:MerR family transcriptional regulator [Microbacterium pseudoresistens]NYD55701.1 DNA-binding transcriptional MerR regulator [Microbacterium pseudoresistens]
MASHASRERSAPTGLLSIGQVLARLTPEFPKLTASKLRYLEGEGIVTPARTESGYRKFSAGDLERLRLALTLQRDRYLPLDVIREHLAALDAAGSSADAELPASIVTRARRYRRDELLAAAGASTQLLNDAVSGGMIAPSDTHPESTVALLRALVALDRYGIEPRHLRPLRQSAERDVALVQSALSTLLRRTDSSSRGKAGEIAPELAARLDEVRTILVKDALAHLLS